MCKRRSCCVVSCSWISPCVAGLLKFFMKRGSYALAVAGRKSSYTTLKLSLSCAAFKSLPRPSLDGNRRAHACRLGVVAAGGSGEGARRGWGGSGEQREGKAKRTGKSVARASGGAMRRDASRCCLPAPPAVWGCIKVAPLWAQAAASGLPGTLQIQTLSDCAVCFMKRVFTD